MTSDDKRSRRKLRHQLQKAGRQHVAHRAGLFATPAQVKAGGRKLADRVLAASRQVPTEVKAL